MGFKRSALGRGIIAANLGMKDQDAVTLLREKRPGTLSNENFATLSLGVAAQLHRTGPVLELDFSVSGLPETYSFS